jgi:hypothetical protein
MSPLPPEILDLIIGFLHDEPDALKACCFLSKSWIHRTRRYLFAHVEFSFKSHIKLWKKTFPDPSNSPARYTRSLSIRTSQVFTSADAGVSGWIRTFSGVTRLYVDISGDDDGGRKATFVSLRGLSPTLKSLQLVCWITVPPPSETFGLVCSFPLLEDLALLFFINGGEVGKWSIPSTSPKLTGCLELKTLSGFRSTANPLLELPSGLHFSKIIMSCFSGDIELAADLVSKCSGTLECLTVCYYGASTVLFLFLQSANILPLSTSTARNSTPFDLSKLTKLKKVELGYCEPWVRWITTTLQTAESINLEEIVIHPVNAPIASESVYREWQDLDYLLLQFWISRSIRPKIRHKWKGGRYYLRDLAPRLLPELTSRGVVDLIETDV